tara:strand:+ start:611 stop:799 length:189 start_codon:yes stop_codon:yes gene_type:complete
MSNERVAKLILGEIKGHTLDISANLKHISMKDIDKLRQASNILIMIAESTFLGAIHKDIGND